MGVRHTSRAAAVSIAVALVLGGTAVALATRASIPRDRTVPNITSGRTVSETTAPEPSVIMTATADSPANSGTPEPVSPPGQASAPSDTNSPSTASPDTTDHDAEAAKPGDDSESAEEPDHETVQPPVREDDHEGDDQHDD